jgi:hypothetical protein
MNYPATDNLVSSGGSMCTIGKVVGTNTTLRQNPSESKLVG